MNGTLIAYQMTLTNMIVNNEMCVRPWRTTGARVLGKGILREGNNIAARSVKPFTLTDKIQCDRHKCSQCDDT